MKWENQAISCNPDPKEGFKKKQMPLKKLTLRAGNRLLGNRVLIQLGTEGSLEIGGEEDKETETAKEVHTVV